MKSPIEFLNMKISDSTRATTKIAIRFIIGITSFLVAGFSSSKFSQTRVRFLVLSAAQAQSLSVSPPSNEIKVKNKGTTRFIDTSGITDPKLRAELGSMARYSGKFNFAYYGPILGDMSNAYQPNPDGSLTHNPTMVRGNMAIRYRLNATSALNFGTGITEVTPFHSGSRTDISTPFVSYDNAFRAGPWQLRASLHSSITTTPELRASGEIGALTVFSSAYRNLSSSRWLVGVDVALWSFFYGRGYRGPHPLPPGTVATSRVGGQKRRDAVDGNDPGDGNAAQLNLNIYPTIKYRLSDKLGAYNTFVIEYFEPRSVNGRFRLKDKTFAERVGVEYSFTKDIYFSPYFTFYPQSLSLATTTINFTTVFSVL